MEWSFEINSTITNKMALEFLRKYKLRPRRPILLSFWCVFVLSICVTLLCSKADEWLLPIIVVGLIILAVIYLPNQYVFYIYAKQKRPDAVARRETLKVGEYIELHAQTESIRIEYQSIVSVVRLKYSYALMLSKDSGLFFDTNGFTKGTFEEFKQFLRQKRPDLRIPE